MKILVATEGPAIDYPIAKHFERALWYLLVDTERMHQHVIQDPGNGEQGALIPQVERSGARVFITGHVDSHNSKLITSVNLRVVIARNMSARKAIEKLMAGELEFVDEHVLRQSLRQNEHQPSTRRDHHRTPISHKNIRSRK